MKNNPRQPELFDFSYEEDFFCFEKMKRQEGFCFIAGVDEAGRGPLAGPVVAAAVILPQNCPLPKNIDDSKKLTSKKRQTILSEIYENSHIIVGKGIISAKIIDEINILNATHLAMKLAVEDLHIKADYCLVDGLPVHGLPVEHLAIVKGDSKSISIAAASIVAKETRDAIMINYAHKFPEYEFEKHKGYGTQKHLAALDKHGYCEIHRKSFEPIKTLCKNE